MADCMAVILVGIQASGKTTFYRQYYGDLVHINLDTLRRRSREKILFGECLEKGMSFVVDNTNPTREDRARYILPAKQSGYKIIGYYFSSSISECIERNRQREGKARIPDNAVACTYNKLEIPEYDEGFDKLYYVRVADGSFTIEEWNAEGKKDEV